MLTFINEELFSYLPNVEKNPQTGREIMQLQVATSNFLVTYAKGSKMDKYSNMKDPIVINKKHDIDMRDNPKIVPINREILTVNYVNDNLQKNPGMLSEQATSLKVTDNTRGVPTIAVRCLQENTPNKSDLYVIAFPFNGMILPIPEDPHYRIYKGMIIPSVRPFYYNGRRYRKILYLVVEPHRALFDPNHKYHTDCIDIKLDSYAIYKDRETNEEKTNHESLIIKIKSETSCHNWEYEILDKAKRIEPDPNTQLWTTFKFDPKPDNRRQNFNRNTNDDRFNNTNSSRNAPRQNNRNNGQRNGHVEGNMYVTTNKHGIRKEVPLGNNGRPNNKMNDLDRMMRESGMYDEPDNRNSDRRGNRKGKKNNRNNRNDYWN